MRDLRLTPLKAAFLLLSTTLFSQTIHSQSIPVLGFTSVVTGLSQPVDVVAEPGSSRLFVVEQGGLIRIVNGNSITGTFLNLTSVISTSGSERGLLSMAFHPDYLNPLNRYFFVYYTNTAGSIELARYRRNESNANIADLSSGRVMLTIPKDFSNHNGGKLQFGLDQLLYFGTGDGGDANDPDNNAQNGNSLLGKMIRLNVDNFDSAPYYTIPADNPFLSDPAVRDEIWALGVRNPWRWSFDRATGDVWIADVGQNLNEEVNYIPFADAGGVNYGWRCREGNSPTPGVPACTPSIGTLVNPIFTYPRSNATGGFSITGGYVYRGSLYPALRGYFVTADYVSGNTWIVRPDGYSRRQSSIINNISGFGESNTGELFALSRSAGSISQVIVTSVLPVDLVKFTGKEYAGKNELRWTTAMEENADKFIVEYSLNGRDFLVAGEVDARGDINGASYVFNHSIANERVIQYRLRMVDRDATSKFSPIISLGSKTKDIKVYPTIVNNQTLQVISGPPIDRISIFTITGHQVHVATMNGVSGYFSVPLPVLQKGIYVVRLAGGDFQGIQKIVVE